MDAARHSLMDNAVQVYMRAGSPHWQCSCSVGGKQFRSSTKEESLSRAKDVARDWYLGLMGKYRAGELKAGPKFRDIAARFIDEYEVITQGQRNPIHVKDYRRRIDNHLNPFFGEKVIKDVTSGLIHDFRIHRAKNGRNGKPPARSTLHKDIVCLRLILKSALRNGSIEFLPDLSSPYKTNGKVTHRAWFSPDEYKQLYNATRERAKNPKKERYRGECENLHDFVLFMVNTGLRPDEALRLEFRDVAIVTDDATDERILEIEVRGKRGVGFCKSMPGAVLPFERLHKRNNGKPTEKLFPKFQRELFNTILDELDLKKDRDGQSRTAYSLRHTYICMRLMEGADIYQIAKNCRTSVEMIETYYASHIKNTLDAAAINVMKPKRPKRKDSDEQPGASL